jgi:hypothetical protein
MPIVFTPADVIRLAPDGSSAKNGQALADARKWLSFGCDDGALWGECQGSGKNPYQSQVDLGETAFKCSCPSRKFPCKHGLGLLLLYANAPATVPKGERPAWVNEWLSSRQARSEKKAATAKESKPVDVEAQAERREQRLNRIHEGMAELHSWVLDWVKSGIAPAPAKGWDFFDAQARRLVDAQAPGVARRVQELGSIATRGAGWQRPFLEKLSLLHLLCRATERIEQLPPDDRANLLAAFGIPISQDDLATLPAVKDTWRIASQTVELEDRLRVQRTWLYGRRSGRAALVLQFAHGTAPLDTSLHPGTEFEGEVVFHPGTGHRAVVRSSPVICRPVNGPFGYDTFASAFDAYSRSLATNPWLDRVLFPVRGVVPISANSQWSVVDAAGESLRMSISDKTGWKLLAMSGGAPLDLTAEFDGQRLSPLAVTANEVFHSLHDGERHAA